MRPPRTSLAGPFLLTLLFPMLTCGQSPRVSFPDDPPDSPISNKTFFRGTRELSFYAAQSVGYPQVITELPTQRLFFVGARLTSHFIEFRHTTVNWNLDIKPLALYSNDRYGPRKYTYGGGTALGLQFVPHTHWRIKLFFDVNGGLLAFTKDTPVPGSRRVNTTLDFGPGLYIPLHDKQAIKLGVQFFHFSNGDTVARNPGFDGILVYTSFTFQNFHFISRSSH